MQNVTWPPSNELLAWRPERGEPDDLVAVDGSDEEVRSYCLAWVTLDAERPGGGAARAVHAVPTDAGDLRIVITDDDEIGFVSPIARLADLPTLGELLTILDGSPAGTGARDGEGATLGIGHPTRKFNDVDGDRASLRGFLSMGSDLYPMLAALDEARFEQWVAEGEGTSG